MIDLLFPDMYIDSVYTMPLDRLKKMGIKALVFDIDNTLEPFYVPRAGQRVVEFFDKLEQNGFKVCILSNNNNKRIELFTSNLNVYAVAHAKKPFTHKLKKVIKAMGVSAKETAMIGDQVFTDVLCGNLMGCCSILTKPMSKRDQFITKVKRAPERQVIRLYQRRVKRGKIK